VAHEEIAKQKLLNNKAKAAKEVAAEFMAHANSKQRRRTCDEYSGILNLMLMQNMIKPLTDEEWVNVPLPSQQKELLDNWESAEQPTKEQEPIRLPAHQEG
jgi:hypothetical protein